MANKELKPSEPWLRRVTQSAKKAAIGALIFLILQIPRIHRLRRRVWVWSCIRIVAALAGGWILWWFGLAQRNVGFAAVAVTLLLFTAFVRARPLVKTLDEKASELGALVTLNGGKLINEDDLESSEPVHLFVSTERLWVVNHQDQILHEVPLNTVRSISARPTDEPNISAAEGEPWELSVDCDSGTPKVLRFRFEGFFAEHLARVAQSTIENLRRKDLPVLK